MKTIGHKTWAIPGGHIPLHSTGREPDYTSRDTLCILNTSTNEANLELTIFYSDRDPVGPYPLKVGAMRTRHVRFNDLIDPQAMPLDVDYACVISSDVPVVAQFNRLDSSRTENAIMGLIAFHSD